MLVLEARERPGGRVEAARVDGGRVVQAGGEVFGHEHWAYRELVEELGLTIEPSYVADPGEMSWGLVEGVFVGNEPPWMSERERADAKRVEREFAQLAASVDPDDPWSHPDADRLDNTSIGGWLRDLGALPAVRRRHELASLSLSCDSPERTSLLGELRKHATSAGESFYDLAVWENLRVAEGSAAVALRMADELGPRLRMKAVVRSIDVSAGEVRVALEDGDVVSAEAVVCAIPAAPLRDIKITGLSDARLQSLRAQRQALAAKVVVAYETSFWQEAGQNGLAETSGCLAPPGRRARAFYRCWFPRSGSRRSSRPRRMPASRPCSMVWWRCTASAPGSTGPCSSGCGERTGSRAATSLAGRRATSPASVRCTAPTNLRST